MTDREPRAWVLNLDAEYELLQPRGYTRGNAMALQLRAAAGRCGLVRPGDVMLGSDEPLPANVAGMRGDTWCPTPRALATLEAAGTRVPKAPPVDTLRRVNDRGFAIGLEGGTLGSRYVTNLSDVEDAVGSIADRWVLKRALSFAGRGHRRGSGGLNDLERRWCHNALRDGLGIVVEPFVERIGDYAQHGFVTPSGEVLLGTPTVQICDAHANWRGSRLEPDCDAQRLSESERSALVKTAYRVGEALAANRYFGPFGIDAFRYRYQETERFNPLVELNARYCMGWAVSGCPRPEL